MRGVHTALPCLLAALDLSGNLRASAPAGTAGAPIALDTVPVGERWF